MLITRLTKNERDIVLPITLGSWNFICYWINFCILFLVPAALKFFISYGAEVVEPFWSFNQYFDFVAILIFATGISISNSCYSSCT